MAFPIFPVVMSLKAKEVVNGGLIKNTFFDVRNASFVFHLVTQMKSYRALD